MIFSLILLYLLPSFISALLVRQIPETSNPPFRRSFASAAYHEATNSLYIYGGISDSTQFYDDLWRFDLSSNTWHEVISPSITSPGSRYLTTIHIFTGSNKLLLYGGTSPKGPTADLWELDLDKNTVYSKQWSLLYTSGDRHVLSIQPATCFYSHKDRNYLAVFGGSSSTGLHNRLFILDLKSYQWREVLNSKAPELYASSIKYDKGNLYIYGGSQILLTNVFFDVIRYNIDSDSWDLIAIDNRSGTVAYYTAVIYKDTFYSIFGLAPTLEQSYSIYKLDLTLQNPLWEKLIISSDYQINRVSQAYAMHQGKVYLFGGTANNLEFNDLILLNLNTNTLQVLSENRSVPTPRISHGLEVYNEEIYVIGGRDKHNNK